MIRLRLAAVPLAAGLGMFALASGGNMVTASGANAVNAAIGITLIYCPLLAGMGAGQGVAAVKTGSALLVKALPLTGIARWLTRQIGLSAAWGAGGLLGILAAAVAISGAHGSWPGPQVAGPVAAAFAATAAAPAVGWAAGLVAPNWFTPPVTAVTLYALPAFDVFGCRQLLAFAGNTSGENALYSLRPAALVEYVVIAAALGVMCVAFGLVVLGGGRRWGFAAAGGMVVALAATTALLGQDEGIWQAVPRGSWSCAPVGAAGSQVCLPPEQRQSLDLLAHALPDLDSKAREAADQTDGLRYEPQVGFDNETEPGAVDIELPIGGAVPDNAQLAEDLAGSMTWRCPVSTSLTPTQEMALGRAQAVLTLWLDDSLTDVYAALTGEAPLRPPNAGEARAAWEEARVICP